LPLADFRFRPGDVGAFGRFALNQKSLRSPFPQRTLREKPFEVGSLSRRMIAYYLSGEQPIPKTVMLATEGFARRMAA
jgi:hypothetical protein